MDNTQNMSGHKPRKVLAGVVVLLAAVGLIGFFPKFQWRARLVTLKARGAVPFLSWGQVIRRLGPSRGNPWQINDLEAAMKWKIRAKEHGGEQPCPALWETPVGALWGRQTDGPLLGFLMQEQLGLSIYQREPVVIRTGDVVLDVGSHLGTFSRYALNHGARLVVAFEPEPTNITCFKRTFQKDISESRVILIEAAAWSQTGTLTFTEDNSNSAIGSVVLGRDVSHPVSVPATTIDESVRRLNLRAVDFVKMDIEGAEREALRGARETIARFGPRMALCIYHRPDDPAVIPEIVLQARPAYQKFVVGEQAYFY